MSRIYFFPIVFLSVVNVIQTQNIPINSCGQDAQIYTQLEKKYNPGAYVAYSTLLKNDDAFNRPEANKNFWNDLVGPELANLILYNGDSNMKIYNNQGPPKRSRGNFIPSGYTSEDILDEIYSGTSCGQNYNKTDLVTANYINKQPAEPNIPPELLQPIYQAQAPSCKNPTPIRVYFDKSPIVYKRFQNICEKQKVRVPEPNNIKPKATCQHPEYRLIRSINYFETDDNIGNEDQFSSLVHKKKTSES